MVLEMDLVRSVVAKIRSVEEVANNPLLKTISYVNTQKGHRIMVYCRTSTVVSTIHDPKKGNIQLVRHDVTYSSLVELLKNAPEKEELQNISGQKRLQVDINGEEFIPASNTSGQSSSAIVTPSSIAQTTRSKNPLTKKLSKRAVEYVDDEAEFDDEIPVPVKVNTATPDNDVAVIEPEIESTLHKSRKVNARGNNSYWKLRHSQNFPAAATNVACFAQSHGGYVAVFDDGTCVYEGIPATVIDVIASQHNRNIAYIAIGEFGQYYVRTRNDREFCSGPVDFENSIRRADTTARLVAFGDAKSYFVLFKDGTRSSHVLLPKSALRILSEHNINSVWIGTNLVHNAHGYFISYQGTTGGTLYTFAGLPSEVRVWIEKKAIKSTQIKQLLSDGDCFIIRYS